jgi:hypothetical protein
MATYRLEAKVISRARGRSATASAAYRAGIAIEDERTGELFDYTGKRGVLHSEIMAPANTPEWMLDRAALWNAVERVERRRDAQLARDFILSLPHELTHEQRVELVRDFLADEFVAHGMVADFAVHAPDRRSDQRNHHAHVMVTMRELTSSGFGLKNRDWNRTELLEVWREHWADTVNHHLERHGHEARVDHRSLEDQGIDREPEPKQGPVATEMERNGRTSHAGDDRRTVKLRNDERNALLREAGELDAALIYLDPDRPRGPAFEDVRQASEEPGPEVRRRRIRPGIGETDGGLVAQQADAMRRFQTNSVRLEEQRERLARGAVHVDAGSDHEGRPDMVSKYDPLRVEQSKAVPEHASGDGLDLAPAQQPANLASEIVPPAQSRSSSLQWMDQSMPAQNAAAHGLTKTNHEYRHEQNKAGEVQGQEENRVDPIELAKGDVQPERRLRFVEERGVDRCDRFDLKREQSAAEAPRGSGDKKLNFGRDDGAVPDLGR